MRIKHSLGSTLKTSTFLFFSLIFFLSGCAFYTVDVSRDDELWGGYSFQEEYIVDKDLFIIIPTLSTKKVLVPESSYHGRLLGRHYMAPNSISEYLKDPVQSSVYRNGGSEYKIDVVGVVKKGTILKTTKLEKRKAWTFYYGNTNDIFPYAEIITGDHTGTTVELTDVSVYRLNPKYDVYVYDPEEGLIRKKE